MIYLRYVKFRIIRNEDDDMRNMNSNGRYGRILKAWQDFLAKTIGDGIVSDMLQPLVNYANVRSSCPDIDDSESNAKRVMLIRTAVLTTIG